MRRWPTLLLANAISNQPSFLHIHLFRYSQHPEYTEALPSLRKEAFQPTFQAHPGDEDNGSLSSCIAWFALGLYPLTCPGKPVYDLGDSSSNTCASYSLKRKMGFAYPSYSPHSPGTLPSRCFPRWNGIDRESPRPLESREGFPPSWLPNCNGTKRMKSFPLSFFFYGTQLFLTQLHRERPLFQNCTSCSSPEAILAGGIRVIMEDDFSIFVRLIINRKPGRG